VVIAAARCYLGDMSKQTHSSGAEDYDRVERAIRFLETNFKSQPSLADIAESACLSQYHFQRIFRRWAGISPTQFLRFLTLEYARERLAESRSLLDASLEAGLSGPSRLHDLFVSFDAMTPGECKRGGAGVEINYGFHPTPFGECLIALTARGICFLGFAETGDHQELLKQLRSTWPEATLKHDQRGTEEVAGRVFSRGTPEDTSPLPLLVRGTNFQVNVWRALLAIPPGAILSYADVAALSGRPDAVRAVGSAIARNPVAYLIPCHRVIAGTGRIHRYRWGTVRKKAMLGREAAVLVRADGEV